LSEKVLKLKAEDLASKTEDLASKTEELNELNMALARANQQLELKTSEQNASNKALFESNRELAQVNKEIAETNKRFALTNKQFALTNKQFVEISKELTAVNKELALAYQTIEQQNKIHVEFINIAAHELRTPIQPILGTAELLKSEIEEATYYDRQDSDNNGIQVEQIKSRLEVIIRNAKRLKELANNILDVSRIESQLLVLNKEHFNLEELISNIISEYNGSQKGKKRLVEFKGDRIIIVKADKDRIAQVISNLLNNAIKFTKEEPEGTIFISCQRKNDDKDDNNNNYVLVNVKDTGKGIDHEIYPRLFSKFITTTSKSSNDGIGIGLFVSKAIVEAHGGKIWAENNSDGKGATFAFSLPID
jgi:signal transduction histidine kinase